MTKSKLRKEYERKCADAWARKITNEATEEELRNEYVDCGSTFYEWDDENGIWRHGSKYC